MSTFQQKKSDAMLNNTTINNNQVVVYGTNTGSSAITGQTSVLVSKNQVSNNLVLEDGYNTDYIYAMITALFYTPSDGMNKIINMDTNNSNTYYIQEYIKSKFILPIHRNMSIESGIVNKLRLFLYNCGWLKNSEKHILDRSNLDDFYRFIITNMMEYSLVISKIDAIHNVAKEQKYDMIRITEEHMFDDKKDPKIVNLSTMVDRWVQSEVLGQNISYKFESVPYILPIYLDIRDPNSGLNKRCVNIMEGINFSDNGDKIQRMFVWEIHSLICQRSTGDYYTVVIDHNDEMMAFSDKQIPSNWKIDATDPTSVKDIMREVRFVFYKLQ